MIKVENGVCEIKTSEGVPGMMTDLSIAVRSVNNDSGERRTQRRSSKRFD